MKRANPALIALVVALVISVACLIHALTRHAPYAISNPPATVELRESILRGHDGETEGTEFWPLVFGYKLKITDTLLVAFTLGLTIFTGLLWKSTEKLWTAGERQLRLAREALTADQRAWLVVKRFEIETLTFWNRVEGSADVQIDATIVLENAGRTPALDVNLRLAIIGNWSTEPEAVREFAANNPYSNLIFDQRMISGGEITEEHPELSAGASELYLYGERSKIRPLIVGCVSYRVLQDSEVRQTGFAFHPRKVPDTGHIYADDANMTVNDVTAVSAPGGFAT